MDRTEGIARNAGDRSKRGPMVMRRLTEEFPRQLLEGYQRSLTKSLTLEMGSPLLLFGMGGSGIAGDLLSALASEVGKTPLLPLRSFSVPEWASGKTTTVFVSYSGDTAETLQAFEEAGRRGLERAVVTSGGALLKAAEREGILAVVVPSGNPPRASLGYLFGALYGLTRSLFPEKEEALTDAVAGLEGLSQELKGPEGWPTRIAHLWGEGELWVYVPERLAAVGRRWKAQSEENAKRLAHFDTVPELLHNALVAWDYLDHLPHQMMDKRRVVMLSGPGDGEEVRKRMDYLSALLKERGSSPLHVTLRSTSPLTEILEGVWIGDYASLLEAEALGVDPFPTPAIDRMKLDLATSQ